MAKIRLVNLVTNGSFETGDFTGWESVRDTQTVGSDLCVYGQNSCKFSGNLGAYSWTYCKLLEPYHPKHIYYQQAYYKTDVATSWGMFTTASGSADGTMSHNVSVVHNSVVPNENFKMISLYTTAPSDANSVDGLVANMLIYGCGSTASGGTTYWDGVTVIDLTDCFGSGNEPTKEWCDEHISWFEGTVYIESDGYIMHNAIQDPLFLYHDNASDLFYQLNNGTFSIKKIDGAAPPHSSCFYSEGSEESQEVYYETTYTVPYINGHKYYAAMDVYGYENEQAYNMYFPMQSPYSDLNASTGVEEANRPVLAAGLWTKASMIVQSPDIATGKYKYRFDNDNHGKVTKIQFTNLMCIDLTVAFGEGNEPDLKWCDTYIVLDSDGTPYIRTGEYGNEYVSNNTNHINFIMKQKTKRLYTKIQSLDSNYNIVGEVKGYCMGGSLDISNSDIIRRSLSMNFVATDSLEINKNSPFWINKRLKVFTGIEDYKNNFYWFDLGVFVPTQPTTSISLTGRTIALNALDKMILADNPVLYTTKIAMGTPIATAIKGLGELYGESRFMLNNYDYTLPYDYEIDVGDSVQDAIKEITNLYMNYECYYNTDGFLVYDKMKNRLYDNLIWDFSDENDFTISRQISADYTKVYNDFKVFGYYDDKKGTQPTYQLTINDNNHPFSVSNMGRTHSLVVEEDNYLDVAQCQERAEFEKQQTENLINNFSIQTAPIYSINDVNRVIRVTDNGNKYTCLIDSITYPLDVSTPMTIGCHEIFI